MQLFLHGGDFGVADPQFGKDLGFYAFDLPFYRLVLSYLFVAVFLALLANAGQPLPLRRHPAVRPHRSGEPRGPHPAGDAGRNPRAAQGRRLLARPLRPAVAHSRGKPFTGAGYTDINAVLPAKEILIGIALICAVLFFFADPCCATWLLPALGLALLVLSAMVIGAGLAADRPAVPGEAQRRRRRKREYIAATSTATRQAYG